MMAEDELHDLIKYAEQGDCEAQNELAARYATGDGVDKSFEKAVFWYEKAASQDSGNAVYNLAFMYLLGDGVKKDEKKAVEMFLYAADQLRNCDARLVIAEAYEIGKLNFEINYLKATEYHIKAALLGAVTGLRSVGGLLSEGKIKPNDLSDIMKNISL